MEKSSHLLEFGKHASHADSMHALKFLQTAKEEKPMTDEMGAHFVATANRLCGRAAGNCCLSLGEKLLVLLEQNGLYDQNLACDQK